MVCSGEFHRFHRFHCKRVFVSLAAVNLFRRQFNLNGTGCVFRAHDSTSTRFEWIKVKKKKKWVVWIPMTSHSQSIDNNKYPPKHNTTKAPSNRFTIMTIVSVSYFNFDFRFVYFWPHIFRVVVVTVYSIQLITGHMRSTQENKRHSFQSLILYWDNYFSYSPSPERITTQLNK